MSIIKIEMEIEEDPNMIDVVMYRLNKITEVIKFSAFVKDKLVYSYSWINYKEK